MQARNTPLQFPFRCHISFILYRRIPFFIYDTRYQNRWYLPVGLSCDYRYQSQVSITPCAFLNSKKAARQHKSKLIRRQSLCGSSTRLVQHIRCTPHHFANALVAPPLDAPAPLQMQREFGVEVVANYLQALVRRNGGPPQGLRAVNLRMHVCCESRYIEDTALRCQWNITPTIRTTTLIFINAAKYYPPEV